MSIEEEYSNWSKRVGGEKLPIYEDEPESGFYKIRLKPRSKQYLPVAIWYDGKFLAVKNGVAVNANDIWLYAVKNPITEQEYNDLMEIYHG